MPVISDPTRVAELDLSQNQFVPQRNALQGFTRLKKLGLAEMEIRTLPTLPDRLEELDISGNGMAKIPVQVATCCNLVRLSIQRNRIESLVLLARLKHLNYLNATDNNIALLHGLENLPNLSTLLIDNNRVKDTQQLAILSTSVQFLSLKNTPVLRFLTTCSQLPGHFVALQDGQLLGSGYERKSGDRRDNSPGKHKVSVGHIDLAKTPDRVRIRSQTPEISSSNAPVLSQVLSEFAALKAQNRTLSAKMAAMESHLNGSKGDFDQFLLTEILVELGVDVNEFSFNLNKQAQLIDVIRDRERERCELKEENEALRAELKSAREATTSAFSSDMLRSDMESQIWELTANVKRFEEENGEMKAIIAKQSRKLEEFDDFKARNKELVRMHSIEIGKNKQLHQLLSQRQKPPVSSQGRRSPSLLLPRPSQGRKTTSDTSKTAGKGANAVQRTLKPDEYFQKLQLCCDLLESHPLT